MEVAKDHNTCVTAFLCKPWNSTDFIFIRASPDPKIFASMMTELFFYHFSPSGDYWWATRNSSDRILFGGCTWREHQGWDMLLCHSLNQVQPQISCRCIRKASFAGPNWTHWSCVRASFWNYLYAWIKCLHEFKIPDVWCTSRNWVELLILLVMLWPLCISFKYEIL